MKTVSFSTSIVFAFVLLNQFTPGNVVAQTENFLTYTNTNYGFTIKYPSDWNIDDSNTTGMGVLFGSCPTNSKLKFSSASKARLTGVVA
jgi:hypothetical protein